MILKKFETTAAITKFSEMIFEDAELAAVLEKVWDILYTLFNTVNISHGSINAENMLCRDGQLSLINFDTAVPSEGQFGKVFLKRDCKNVAKMITRLGLKIDDKKLIESILSCRKDLKWY